MDSYRIISLIAFDRGEMSVDVNLALVESQAEMPVVTAVIPRSRPRAVASLAKGIPSCGADVGYSPHC